MSMYSTLETKHLDAYNKSNGIEHGIKILLLNLCLKVP